MTDLVAPQRISPRMISSRDSGVAMHAVEGLLIVHPDERGVGVFEERVVHDVHGDQRRGDEGDIGEIPAPARLPHHQAAEADAEGEQVEQRLEQGRNEVDLPDLPVDGEVPLPNPEEPAADGGGPRIFRPVRSFPQLPSRQFQKYILQSRHAAGCIPRCSSAR